MLKWELAQKMQEIDQQLQEGRKQIKLDTFSLQAAHNLFDEIAGESLEQMAMLKGESVDKKQDTLVVLQARLMGDEEEEKEEDSEDW